MKHIANTAAILRFPTAQYDMVRLGIGLYGIENVGHFEDKLQTVGTLKTTITQLRKVAAGQTIGYSRKGVLQKEKEIQISIILLMNSIKMKSKTLIKK